MDSEWQPIETAPKDGVGIMLGCPEKVCMGWWEDYDGTTPMWTELLAWNSVKEDYVPEPLGFTPTHWMPLPTPPVNKED